MPDEIYTPEQKATLEKGIQQMLSQGASDQDVMAYAAAYKQKYGVKKKENTVLPSKVGSSASPKSKVDALADNKTLGTPTGEQFSYAPEAFSENEVKYAPTSKANPPKVPQPIVKPKEEFEYYAPDIYADEVIAPKSQGVNPLTGKPNNPNQYKEAKPSITNDEFNNRLKNITPELTSKEEEYVVPQLNYQFKDFGYKFEETGVFGENVLVIAPNGKQTTINMYGKEQGVLDQTASKELQKFMRDNSLQYDKLNKVVSEADNYNRTFNEQKEIDASFAKIQQDQQDFTKSVQELYKLPKDSEEYKTKLAELSQRQVQIENNKKDLNKSVGQYVGMKAQQGETSAYLWNQLLEGTTGAVSGLHGLMVDAFAPETMSDAEKKKAKQWLNPIIRESLDWAKSESTTKEYAQNVGFIEGAVGGLVKSLPAMLAAEGMPLVMAAQISDDLDVEMDNNPDFANISENEKLLLKAPMMIGGAVLETYGFRNAIGTKGLLNDLVANAIGKSTKTTTTKSFKEFIEQDIENRLSKGLIKVGAGGLAEFETGASQELLDITTKDIYNAAKGKEMFQTPDSFGEGATQVIKAGLQEAIGGFILSTPSAISTAYKKGNYTDLTDGQVDVLKAFGNDVNVMSAIETDLQNKVATGDLTPKEADEQLNDTRETVGVMNSIDTEELSNDQIKEALPIVDEIKKLEQQKEGKIPIQKKIIQAKIDELNAKLLKATGNENILEPTKKENDAIQEPTKGGSGGVGGDVETKRKETEAKIKRKDLFSDGGVFANELGGSGVNSVPTNHSERNGIEFVQFSNPNTGVVDVIMTGKSDNDFVGYYRIYENGKATNKWSSKFENQSRNKEDFKTMISGVQEMLPQGHEYTEKTSISTDGLRIWNQQLSRGYELQYDSKGNLITNRVAINGDAINNELGIAVNKGDFENVSVTNNADMKKVKEALLPYLQKFGLNGGNIHFENGTVEIDLPVLKNTKAVEQSLKETTKEEVKPITNKTNGSKTKKTKTKTDEAKVLIEEPQTAVEQSAAEGVISVYHGGSVKDLSKAYGNLYVSEDKSQAEAYAKGNGGKVQEFKIAKKDIADEDEVRKIIVELGLQSQEEGWDLSNELMMHEILDPSFSTSLGEKDLGILNKELSKRGFKAIEMNATDITGKKRNINDILVLNPKETLIDAKKETKLQTPKPIVAETKQTESKSKAKPKQEISKGKEIVLNEGSGKIINDLFNEWNSIKDEKDQAKWNEKIKNTKFGTYGTVGLMETIKKFNPKMQEVIKRNFYTEIEAALDIPKNERTFKPYVVDKIDQSAKANEYGLESMTDSALKKQFLSVKEKYPDAIALFRVGDFYETLGDDAVIISKDLGIPLTDNKGTKLAGFSSESVDKNITALVKLGRRVALVEQNDTKEEAEKRKQKNKERVTKAKEAFIKKGKNLQFGGLETLPEFTELVAAYIEMGYVTAKEILQQFREDLEGFTFDEKIATDKINEILAKEGIGEKPKEQPKSKPTEDSGKVKKKVAKKSKKVTEEKPFVSTNKKDTKVIDDLINNIEESGAVEEYLSKGTISSATGETPTNDQKRGVQKLSLALEQGLKIVAYAKELYGDNYVEEFVNYLENSKAPISNIALGFVSLENALYREKMANPERANELTKLQAYVYSRSQLRSRESSKALNYQKLRRFGEVGYDMSEIEKKFFSDIEYEDKGKIEDAVQADMDKINEVALEVEKSFIPKEIEQLIEEAVQKELSDIYETLPPTKKNYAKRALKSLTEVQKKLRSKTYDATVGIPIAIIDFGIESIKKAIQAGVSVSQAIEVGIKAIKSKLDGKEWAKESEFREDALSEFAKFMPKTNETVKQALIKAGFGRTVNIKGQEKEILDWKKLAGAAGTIENIKRNVETVLREEGMNQKEINDMADELTEEYVNLRESVINKAQNDIARRNKEKVTPKQRSAARRLAELYNFGLFEKNVDEFERAIVGALGSKVSEEGLKEAKAIGRAMEAIYATSFRGVPLNDISAKKALEELSNKLRILLYKESKKQGTKFLKFAGIVRNYMELNQSMILNTFKNLFENPYSGFQQNLLDTLNSKFSGTDTKELAKQRRKMMLDIVKDMTLKGAIGYGKIDSQFVNRQHLDDYINKLSDKKLYHFISSIATGKLGLNTMDAMFKASITEKKFAHNLITIMTNESNPNRMSKENAIAFVSETLTGQTYKDAQKTAKDITDRINGISNQELMPTNKAAIDRLASDIVKAALQMGNKISADMVEAAYNAAYKNAGLNLGHEPNNMFSRQVQSFAARLESQVDTALKNKQYNKAGKLMLYSTFIRNVVNPFAVGGTNWLVLKFEKMGGGLITGLYNSFGEDLSIDMSTKTGLAKVEQRLYLQSAIKDQFWRGTVGGLVTLMGYIGYAAFLDDDEEFNKWVKENYWSMKYLAFVLSEGALIDISAENGKLEQYFTKMLGKNEMFESSTKLVKAANYYNKGENDKAIGALGESTSKFFNTPIPWRLVRDGVEIYKGVKGEDPYHPNYKPSEGFISGVLQGGFIEWLGYRPLPTEIIKHKKINRGESTRGGRVSENVRGQ